MTETKYGLARPDDVTLYAKNISNEVVRLVVCFLFISTRVKYKLISQDGFAAFKKRRLIAYCIQLITALIITVDIT